MILSPLFWPTVKLLPLDITGDLTDYEFLLKICHKLKELVESNNKLSDSVTESGQAIELLQKDINNILTELEAVKNGDYVSLYLDSIIEYINNNLESLVGNIVQFVIFGLTQDGHFCAMTPKTWEFIHWDTIMDYSQPTYGHLVLRW